MKRYILRRDPGRGPECFRIDYRRELNPAQYEAVVTTEGPVLVVAGAGSGKTRTLVYRVARLVEMGVPPGSLLLLTFTRRAAQEMLRRAALLVGAGCAEVAGGTFHSFANLVLRRYGRVLGLSPSFTILDRGDSEDAVNLMRSRLGLDRKERRFPRKQTIMGILSMAVNRAMSVSEVMEGEYPHLLADATDVARIGGEYAAYKRARQLVDYDDLLVHLRNLLVEHAEVAERLSRTYGHIMVDEYQDTNRLQAEIVRGLAVTHENVMVVGDDAQSIYHFRGANFRNIMDFPQMFPGTRIVKLEENYRSTQPILDLGNAVINQAVEKYTKNLFTRRGGGARPALVQAENEQSQSRFVCQKILELREEEDLPLSEIAVLFRSSYHSFDLELELQRANVRFVKRGGFKFIETAHIKDVLAYLRVAANRHDAISWHRVLLLCEGVGPRTAEEVTSWVTAGPEPPGARLGSFQARGVAARELRRLGELLTVIGSGALAPGEMVNVVVEHYTPILERLHREDYPKRLKDLEHFGVIAQRYRSLGALLTDMALEPPSDSVDDVLAADPDEGLLTLSTIHSAKGLEWEAVFLIWAAEGRFPSSYMVRGEADMEEERRLMYVAVTRAKTHLFITYPIVVYDRSLGLVMGKPSRFLTSLPEGLAEPVMVVEAVER